MIPGHEFEAVVSVIYSVSQGPDGPAVAVAPHDIDLLSTHQPWHPTNFRNQEKLWKAEQKEKERLDREREKEVELKKSLDLATQQRLVKAAGGDPTAIRDLESHPLNFMYIKPPGLARDGPHDGGPG